MHTLVDFITQVKGIEYHIIGAVHCGVSPVLGDPEAPALLTLVSTGKEDLEHIKQNGYGKP